MTLLDLGLMLPSTGNITNYHTVKKGNYVWQPSWKEQLEGITFSLIRDSLHGWDSETESFSLSKFVNYQYLAKGNENEAKQKESVSCQGFPISKKDYEKANSALPPKFSRALGIASQF